ncbi:Globin [Penicillium mononematosum]|uniref:Globin n=1 Tax=Penicillium mononematosum TaxID=268346 RepID=UPI002546C2BE|nr:Globin [Penicillium mononematosum]KAJ6190875.1 Globin [Penicillium mononematosum]
MTPEQTELITKTVPVVDQYGQEITRVFYKNMLAAHPELYSVFNKTNQDTGHQAKVLAKALYAYAANIRNLEALGPMVELVSHKHVSLEITPNQYNIVGKYLIGAMQEVLGVNFTENIQEAWTAAYGQLAGIMIQKEASLYDQHDEWKGWKDFRVTDISRESDEISSFYLSLSMGSPFRRLFLARQYSMSDLPSPTYYRISVKREHGQQFAPGLLSNTLHEFETPGKTVQVSHPRGNFLLKGVHDRSPVVLIAGGVGITPLLCMLKSLTSTAPNMERHVHLVYATRTTSARAFFTEIMEIGRRNPTVKLAFFVECPGESDQAGKDYHHIGRIDLRRLGMQQDLFIDDFNTRYYICGPSPFLETVKRSLLSQGVTSTRINMEIFGAGGFDATKPQEHL